MELSNILGQVNFIHSLGNNEEKKLFVTVCRHKHSLVPPIFHLKKQLSKNQKRDIQNQKC